MLTLQDVTKSYGGARSRAVLRDVSLTVDDGELVAIMGESGAGKSTLLNLIAGLDVPDSGSVVLDGTDLARLDDDARTVLRRSRMGFVFQAFHLLPYLDVGANVALPLALLSVDLDARRERAAASLAAVGLAGLDARKPATLSGGEMQRAAIARALVHRPRLVLADEPTGNLDSHTGAEIMDAFHSLHRAGSTIVLITHDAAITASLPRCVSLLDGRVVADERALDLTAVRS